MLTPADRYRGAQEAVASRHRAEADAAAARAEIQALEADRASLQDMLKGDRFDRFLQASTRYQFDHDLRFEPAVQENSTDRRPAWWKVSGISLAVGFGGALLLSQIPGVAPFVPGLVGALGLYGAIVGPSNVRNLEKDTLKPRRVDRMITDTVRRELAAQPSRLEAARQKLQAAEARLARPDAEVAREMAERAEPARTIDETPQDVAIGGVRLPRN